METQPTIPVHDPVTGRTWAVPGLPIRHILADTRDCWMLNVALPPAEAARLIEAPFLEPHLIDGRAVLALCLITMDRAAPDWAALALGPAVRACALRLACRHRRTGEPAVWVANHCTDHVLGRVLPLLGFPAMATGLRSLPGLEPGLIGRGLLVSVHPGAAPKPTLFPDEPTFDHFIADGVRSYGRGPRPGTWSVVDLIPEPAAIFTLVVDRTANLVIAGRPWPVDGIYRCVGGRWRWEVPGLVDAAGGTPSGAGLPAPAAGHAA